MRLQEYRAMARSPGQRAFVAVAVVFAGLFLVGLAGFVVAGLGAYPSPLTATTSAIENYFRDSRDAVRLNAFVQLVAAVPLLAYGAIAGTRLRALGDRSAAPTIAAAAATLSAGCLTVSAVTQWVLSRPHTLDTGGTLLRALQDLAFISGGPGHVGFLGLLAGTVSLAAWSARRLPRWIAVLGGLVAVLSGLSILTLVFDGAANLLPIARFPSFLWLLATAVALPGTAQPAPRRVVTHRDADNAAAVVVPAYTENR